MSDPDRYVRMELRPPGFRMCVKAPRGLSHGRRLYRPETWTARLVDGWHELGERRGVLLVQPPPDQPCATGM
jgi:uncharacterized protein YecE (DUF72 family)